MSKEKLVLQLFDVFRQQGYASTSLSQISQVTGLGKASLYHHFPGGKEEMVETVLSYLDEWFEANILKILQGHATSQKRIEDMLKQVEAVYNKGHRSCLWAVLTLEQSYNSAEKTGTDRFHARIKETLLRWIDALADVLKETGLPETEAKHRAEDAILRIQGALILTRGLDDTAPFDRTLNQLAQDLLNE